eukprot:6899105-Lingulodinium_polyedra.AAC.1
MGRAPTYGGRLAATSPRLGQSQDIEQARRATSERARLKCFGRGVAPEAPREALCTSRRAPGVARA